MDLLMDHSWGLGLFSVVVILMPFVGIFMLRWVLLWMFLVDCVFFSVSAVTLLVNLPQMRGSRSDCCCSFSRIVSLFFKFSVSVLKKIVPNFIHSDIFRFISSRSRRSIFNSIRQSMRPFFLSNFIFLSVNSCSSRFWIFLHVADSTFPSGQISGVFSSISSVICSLFSDVFMGDFGWFFGGFVFVDLNAVIFTLCVWIWVTNANSRSIAISILTFILIYIVYSIQTPLNNI